MGFSPWRAREVEDIHRLTPLQRSLLLYVLYAPGSGMYFDQFARRLDPRLEGEVDEVAYGEALAELTARHGALRASFVWEGLEEPVQVVRRRLAPPLEIVDWGNVGAAEGEARLRRFLARQRRRGFDPGRAPLWRVTLVRAGGAGLWRVWSYSHLLLDGWSVALVGREFDELYAARRQSRRPRLPPPPRPFRDHVAWLARRDPAPAREHFRRLLARFDGPTPLAPAWRAGEPPAVEETYPVAAATVPAEVAAALGALARRRRITANTLVQGAWAVVLGGLGGRRAVAWGVTLFGRPAELIGSESMVGVFVNTLPLIADLDPSAPLNAWLEELHHRQQELRRHEHTPLSELQEWAREWGWEGGLPLFESVVAYENYPLEAAGRQRHGRWFQKTSYPLALFVEPEPHLHLRLGGDGRRFSAAALRRLLGRLLRLLAEMGEWGRRRGARLGDLDPLSAAERHQLTREWAAPPPLLAPLALPDIVARAARRRGEAVAVEAEGEGGARSLSLGELARRGRRLAAHLRRRGLRREERVAVCAGRHLRLPEAVLGLWWAGGVYLPLDPAYPAARLGYMLEDADPRWLLTAGGAASSLAVPAAVEKLALEAVPPVDGGAPLLAARELGAAYVIYTSGSTGRPKGAVLTHGGLAAVVAGQRRALAPPPGARLLQFAALGFDASIFELALALGGTAEGGVLCLARREDLLPGPALVELLARRRIQAWLAPPSALAAMPPGAPRALPALAVSMVGGEACPAALVEAWAAPGRRFYNLYGPTEATIWATWARCRPDGGKPPIGRAVAGTRLYLVDRRLRPTVPEGAGELALGGAGVGRGYLERPGRAAASFVPDPFAAEPGARLYRSGDVARWRPDGELEFLGRGDDQIKVRGFRVEPGEVEAALAALPGVGAAAVVPRNQVLVAYVEGAGLSPAGLRRALAERLPAHLVPSAYVVLPELPRTPAGKVDRRALPDPPAAVASARPPATAAEELLLAVWSEVLERPVKGVEEDFFALGGHSLLLPRLASHARRALGVDLELRDFFQATTVAAQARRAEAARGRPTAAPPPRPRSAAERRAAPPLSFAQERLWFLERLESGGGTYAIPLVLRLARPPAVAALISALAALTARHEALRTAFPAGAGGPEARIAPPPANPLPVVDLAALGRRAGAEAARLAEVETERPFPPRRLAAGPLFRPRLLRVEGEGESLLLLTQHHLVSDGHSVAVLLRDLDELYRAARRGGVARLPALPVTYTDFAAWQRRWLRGEALERLVGPWRERLAGMPEVLELPVDRPRPAVASHRGGVARRAPGGGARRALARLGGLAEVGGATPFMVLAAAWAALLARWCDQRRLVLAAPVAGRDRPEVEEVVGCFVNTLPLPLEPPPGAGFGEFLAQARETCLGAYALQDLPFEKLVEELRPRRRLSHAPLAQAMVAWQGEPPPCRLGEVVEPEGGAAKLDLVLEAVGRGEDLTWRLTYARDLFDATTAGRHLRHLEALLEAALAAPGAPLGRLPWLAAGERHQLLAELNDTAAPEPRRCLDEITAAGAAARPEAVAVVAPAAGGDVHLGYRRSEAAVASLARRLEELGAGAERVVGVLMERSPAQVLAARAALRAGAAYLPLDPELPAERLAFMIADAAPAVVVADPGTELPAGAPPVPVMILDGGAPRREPAALPPRRRPGAGAAYVIYTSGSTGRPKGVVNHHRGIANRLRWMGETYRLGPDDAVLYKTPFGFDVSVWEIFWPAMAGARQVVAAAGDHRDPRLLRDLMLRQRVTVTHFVPSMLGAFLDVPGVERCAAVLRQVVASGEALGLELARRCAERLPGVALDNLYGPTEAAVDVSREPAAAAERFAPLGGAVPLGRPISNLRWHVADHRLELLPLGAAGELLLAGAGLARGYLGRPALTAERFVPAAEKGGGERWYRSGDLARRLADGRVEYLGRLDHQIKLRGQRVELGEIEAALAAHEAVREAVVVARGESLAACAVPEERAAAPLRRVLALEAAGRLAGHLLHELPDGILVAHLNRGETEFMYEEIFQRRTYLKHGVELEAGAWVVDVGANIGLFSLFAARHAPGARLLAFEPVPEICDTLRLNAEIHGCSARRFECFDFALGAEEGEVEITYYPRLSLLSGAHGDAAEEARVMAAFLRQQAAELPAARLGELLDEHLASRRLRRPARPLGAVLRELEVERVDLLKVDVEKSELEVLAGLDDETWGRVRQVVAEVHGAGGRLEAARRSLRERGFRVTVEQDEALGQTDLYNVYAVRPRPTSARHSLPPSSPPAPSRSWSSPARLTAELLAAARRRLPAYMVPARLTLLTELPRTASGKVDRHALAALEPAARGRGERGGPPRDALERRLARLWRRVLGLGEEDELGVEEDFFARGGHSLLAVRLLARVEAELGRALPLSAMFRHGTVAGLARLLRGAGVELDPAGIVELAPVRAEGAAPPLFLVHDAGGGVGCYAALARALAAGGGPAVYGLPSPASRGEPLPESAGELARAHLEVVRAVAPDRAPVLGGWSLGGVIALEMARQLRSRGVEVPLVVLLDSVPPELAGLEDEPPAGALEALAVAGNGELWRAHGELLRRHRPAPYDGPVLLLRARETAGRIPGGDHGWGFRCPGGLEVVDVEGNHFDLLAEPRVARLAAELGARLALPPPVAEVAAGSRLLPL